MKEFAITMGLPVVIARWRRGAGTSNVTAVVEVNAVLACFSFRSDASTDFARGVQLTSAQGLWFPLSKRARAATAYQLG